MNKACGTVIATIIAIEFFMALAHAGSKSKGPLTEDAAVNILLGTLKHDNVYAKRISLDCITFDTEETTRIYVEIAVRENHTAKCGGDPETSPVIDRYRVNRASGKIELYEAAGDRWHDYSAAKIK
jgi:hypothetical protein